MVYFVSWNVDGYNDSIHSWLKEFIQKKKPDLIFLSETKRTRYNLEFYFDQFTEYNYIINTHTPAQYHGVAMLIHKSHKYSQYPVQMNITVRNDSKSNEAATGRIIAIQLNQSMNIIGCYTPNSGRALEKLDYRVKVWDPAFFYLLELLRSNGPTLWLGDINVALTDLDVSNPVMMRRWAGFTPEERQNLQGLLSTGNWYDAWRLQNPTSKEYSWIGYNKNKGYGMRLDNIIISSSLISQIKSTDILKDSSKESDHLPITIYLL
jgi:exodeoxyribonuclease III